jgi:hypothetical protein
VSDISDGARDDRGYDYIQGLRDEIAALRAALRWYVDNPDWYSPHRASMEDRARALLGEK